MALNKEIPTRHGIPAKIWLIHAAEFYYTARRIVVRMAGFPNKETCAQCAAPIETLNAEFFDLSEKELYGDPRTWVYDRLIAEDEDENRRISRDETFTGAEKIPDPEPQEKEANAEK